MLSRRDGNGTGNVHMLSRRDGNGTGRREFLLMKTGRESNMAPIFQTRWDGTITFYSGTGNNGKIAIVDGKGNEKGNGKIASVDGKDNGKPTGDMWDVVNGT